MRGDASMLLSPLLSNTACFGQSLVYRDNLRFTNTKQPVFGRPTPSVPDWNVPRRPLTYTAVARHSGQFWGQKIVTSQPLLCTGSCNCFNDEIRIPDRT